MGMMESSIYRFVDSACNCRSGASWGGYALEQVLALSGTDNAYYWGTQRIKGRP